MFTLRKYDKTYEDKYCNLYIPTWSREPYGELFSRENVISHLTVNSDYLYLLINDEIDDVLAFVGGRPLANNCDFFVNNLQKPIDIERAFYIDELGVDQNHKRNGWGFILMSYLVNCAREKGYSQFVLRTHADHSNPAIGLYYKLGMKPRLTNNGTVHGVWTKQDRIDDRPTEDFRIYFYKEF